MGRAERALLSRCIPCRPSSAGGLPVSPLALNDWQSVARQLEGHACKQTHIPPQDRASDRPRAGGGEWARTMAPSRRLGAPDHAGQPLACINEGAADEPRGRPKPPGPGHVHDAATNPPFHLLIGSDWRHPGAGFK
jgi:hypothetical protein